MTIDLGTVKIIPISEIKDWDNAEALMSSRIRREYGDIPDLAKNIRENGLMHPLVVYSPKLQPPYRLLAGGRRLLACIYLKMTEVSVRIYDKEKDEKELLAIEFFENLKRQNLTHAEEVIMKEKLNNLLISIHGEKVGKKADSKGHSAADLAKALGQSKATLSIDMKLARALRQLPELQLHKATNKTAAITPLSRFDQVVTNKATVDARKAKQAVKPSADRPAIAKLVEKGTVLDDLINAYHCGDFFENKLVPGQFSLIEVDPVYGIDLPRMRKAEEKSRLESEYAEISGPEYLGFLQNLLETCFKLAAEDCWLILWCGPQWLAHATLAMDKAGFFPCKIPAIWKKGNSMGQSFSPDTNLGNSYEMFIYGRKGKSRLRQLGRSNIFDFNGVPRSKRIHDTERPREMMKEILSTFAWPEANVLVPFAGSGNTIVSAFELGMTAVGFDLSREYYEAYVSRVIREDALAKAQVPTVDPATLTGAQNA